MQQPPELIKGAFAAPLSITLPLFPPLFLSPFPSFFLLSMFRFASVADITHAPVRLMGSALQSFEPVAVTDTGGEGKRAILKPCGRRPGSFFHLKNDL